ncbi:MAG: response regulator transcription factor [Acidobacteria bacterium]|nr:response regulator transcription factor [Acidobacteriota bacterium]MCB9397823.1 response regulator transcription factor [Acidobacteriota bacterium]
MIRILLAEDQAMVLGALAALLNLETDLDVVGCAKNGNEALQLCQTANPDVLVTDIEMPGMTGLDLAAQLKALKSKTRVLILTTFARPGFLRRALEAGVNGYLLKDAPADQLADAVRRVAQGLRVIDPELALAAWSDPNPLSERERQILNLAGTGLTNQEIAETLHLAEGTVRNYLSETLAKLDARNRVEAYRLAKQKGWL